MRLSITVGALLALLACVFLFGSRDTRSTDTQQSIPGGVILISIDTLRANHTSVYGYHKQTSPTLSHLAEQSVVFDVAYSTAPWTLPSHAGILTGLPSQVHLVYKENSVLDPRLPTLAQAFKSRGYRTAAWIDSPILSKKFGLNRGFEVYDEGMGGASQIFRRALEWIRINEKSRFFAFVHVFDVHAPYKGTRRFFSAATAEGIEELALQRRLESMEHQQLYRYRGVENLIDAYDSGIFEFDSRLKGFLQALEREKVLQPSTILILSDHGESLMDHGIYIGHSIFLYDGEVRVPLILKLPYRKHGGMRISSPVSLLSVMPTLLDIRQIPIPNTCLWPSLRPLIDGKEVLMAMPIVSHSSHVGTLSVQNVEWKWITASSETPEQTVRAHLLPKDPGVTEILKERIPSGEQLFNLRHDPNELLNQAAYEQGPKAKLLRDFQVFINACQHLRSQYPLAGAPPPVPLDQESKDQLRALGYAQP